MFWEVARSVLGGWLQSQGLLHALSRVLEITGRIDFDDLVQNLIEWQVCQAWVFFDAGVVDHIGELLAHFLNNVRSHGEQRCESLRSVMSSLCSSKDKGNNVLTNGGVVKDLWALQKDCKQIAAVHLALSDSIFAVLDVLAHLFLQNGRVCHQFFPHMTHVDFDVE